MYRVSLFLYCRFYERPYFTYYRLTTFTRGNPKYPMSGRPTEHQLRMMEMALKQYAEIAETLHGVEWGKIKREVEQMEPPKGKTVPIYPDYSISEASGAIPKESYVGFGQADADDDSEDDLEG